MAIEQIARGLYGPLIVEEPDPPAVDHDITVVLDDWRLERSGALDESFGNRHDFSHAGRMGNVALRTRRGHHGLGAISLQGSNPAPRKTPIAPLPPAHAPAPDRDGGTRLDLIMQGGAMGGRHGGNDFWAFNDRSGLPDRPWRRFARGETARIVLRNDTAFPHGIHLHGHHFHEIREDGGLGHYRDTTLVYPRESRAILCVFDNPGKWLLHCHTLAHQASGMKTWVEVA